MESKHQVLKVGIEERLSKSSTVLYAFQHLLALTGIFLFPVLIGQALGMENNLIGYMIQACFITTGIVTILQSGRLLKLPVVQGPTAIFFVIILSSGLSVGLAATFGSMLVAGIIFMLLALPIKKLGIMGHLIRFISPPIVFGTLLLIIGAQLASIGVNGWFGSADADGSYSLLPFLAAVVTVTAILLFMIFGGSTFVRRGSLLLGIIIGTVFYAVFGTIDFSSVSTTGWVGAPAIFPFGFDVSWPVVAIMLLAYLQAGAEAMGMYTLLTNWGNQSLTKERVNRGLFGEFFGCSLGAMFGGIGTTSYPENIGIIRITGIGSRYVTMTAGILAITLGLIPKFGLIIASLPSPVLTAASTILFGTIAVSGIQMLSRVEWDELNMAVAAPAFIISLGTLYIPEQVIANLPAGLQEVLTEPMLIGIILLIVLNTIINFWLRPIFEQQSNKKERKLQAAEKASNKT